MANLLLASQADPTKLPALLQQLQLDRYAADLDQTLQPNQLSPGEQRRLGIIRAVLPQIVHLLFWMNHFRTLMRLINKQSCNCCGRKLRSAGL